MILQALYDFPKVRRIYTFESKGIEKQKRCLFYELY